METKKINYEDEIKAAEEKLAALKSAQAKDLEEKKRNASLQRKAEADKVENAFKNLNAVTKSANEKLEELRKIYLDAVNSATENWKKAAAEQEKLKTDARAAYNDELNTFIKNHPEGYHLTLRDGDNIQTLSGYGNGKANLEFEDFNVGTFIDNFFSRFGF